MIEANNFLISVGKFNDSLRLEKVPALKFTSSKGNGGSDRVCQMRIRAFVCKDTEARGRRGSEA